MIWAFVALLAVLWLTVLFWEYVVGFVPLAAVMVVIVAAVISR